VIDGFLGDIDAAQHSCQLLNAFFLVENLNARSGCLAIGNLAYTKMLIGETGDLGKVGNAQDLPVGAQLAQAMADHFGNATAHAAIDFVEDHCGNGAAIARNHLDSEAHPRQFTARCYPGQRHGFLARVGADQEINLVDSPWLAVTLCQP
jgi:hypothetical protein